MYSSLIVSLVPVCEQRREKDLAEYSLSFRSFDESLESGFSTPNSRSRRIIREIIV